MKKIKCRHRSGHGAIKKGIVTPNNEVGQIDTHTLLANLTYLVPQDDIS